MRHFYPILIGIILIVLSTPLAYAEEPQNAENPQRTMKRSSLFAPAPREYVRPFTWGAEIGASIDLSGTENSTIDIDLFAGYRHAMLKCLGVGVGIHPSFQKDQLFVPIYALCRYNILPQNSLLFVEGRAGYSINKLPHNNTQGGFYGSAGLGINLSMSRRFDTHIILAYSYMNIGTYHYEFKRIPAQDSHMVTIRIGISF